MSRPRSTRHGGDSSAWPATPGARLGELCAVTRSALDLGKKPTLRIWRTTAEDEHGQEVLRAYPKTNAALRRISLGPDAEVRAHLERQEKAAADAGVLVVDDFLVFSLDLAGAEHWFPDRITNRWTRTAGRRVCHKCVSTTSATSWPPRPWRRGCTSAT